MSADLVPDVDRVRVGLNLDTVLGGVVLAVLVLVTWALVRREERRMLALATGSAYWLIDDAGHRWWTGLDHRPCPWCGARGRVEE